MNEFIQRVTPIIVGFAIDAVFGDSPNFPHPVRLIGGMIDFGEKKLRGVGGKRRLLMQGALLSVFVTAVSFLIPFLLLKALSMNWVRMALESFFCYQILAAKSLWVESMRVYDDLARQDTDAARASLSRIVGRDTQSLDEAGIAKAAVETVAENLSDGVIAPMLYMFLGGAPLGFLYKAINTLDSMIGYKNEKYMYFGRFAARLDDAANYIPSRISALLMLMAGGILNLRFGNGVKIFYRDRHNHKSPNSAQTEAACAGLLGIELAGGTYYGGILIEKPSIGDGLRDIETEDIKRANRLMYASAILGLAVFSVMAFLIYKWM